jgi:tetratricopeptide (TPR) repeat protein
MKNNTLNQAISLQQNGKVQEAIKLYISLLEDNKTSNKDKSAISVNVANIFIEANMLQEALEYCQSALEFDKHNQYAMLNLGVIFFRAEELTGALEQYKKLKKIIKKQKSKDSAIYDQLQHNIALVYFKLKDYEKAIKLFTKIDKKSPQADIRVNLGDCYMNLLDYKTANSYYQKALELNPNHQFALTNQALCLKKELKYDEVLTLYEKALKIEPKNPRIRYNYAIALLENGDYINGWREYEARLDLDFSEIAKKKQDFGIPLYKDYDRDLSKLIGKKLLIVYEQGFGDNLQAFRYIKELQKKGIEVYTIVYEELRRLFGSIKGLHIITNETIDDIAKCDFFMLSMSLPYYFRCELDNIPSKKYLFVDKEPFIDELFTRDDNNSDKYRLKIGFVWNGDINNIHNETRALELHYFDRLFQINDVGYYSLQVDKSKKELKKYQKNYTNIIDCSPYINDFYDTASIIEELDFVIVIDSAIAHLSGALAKETIIILSQTPEIRWPYNLESSPWYPNTKIIRQSDEMDLNQIFDKIKILLS